jgi:hypothetical protein
MIWLQMEPSWYSIQDGRGRVVPFVRLVGPPFDLDLFRYRAWPFLDLPLTKTQLDVKYC